MLPLRGLVGRRLLSEAPRGRKVQNMQLARENLRLWLQGAPSSRMSHGGEVSRAAEAEAAKRLAAAAEETAKEAESIAAAAAAEAIAAAEEAATAERELRQLESVGFRSAAASSVRSPDAGSLAGGRSDKAQRDWELAALQEAAADDEYASGQKKAGFVSGAGESSQLQSELASIPKRSIKEIMARDRAQQQQQQQQKGGKRSPGRSHRGVSKARTDPPPTGPRIPVDSFAIVQAKKAKDVRGPSRNRFDLMSAPDTKASAKIGVAGHAGLDSWQNSAVMAAKQHTQGAIKKEHVGVKATVTKDNVMFDFATKLQPHVTESRIPKRSTYQGVKPHIPLDGEAFLAEAQKMKELVNESNKLVALPRPQIETDAWGTDAQRRASELASEANSWHATGGYGSAAGGRPGAATASDVAPTAAAAPLVPAGADDASPSSAALGVAEEAAIAAAAEAAARAEAWPRTVSAVLQVEAERKSTALVVSATEAAQLSC